MQRLKKNKNNSKRKSELQSKPGKQLITRVQKPLSRGFLVKHEEYIANITLLNAGFTIYGKSNGFAINAGSQFTFPWLFNIARCYDKYRFHTLRFELRSSNPVTHAGAVYMALDTDTTDPAPASVSSMLSMRYSARSPVYETCVLQLGAEECKQLHMPMSFAYVKEKAGADPAPNVYTVGRLWIAGVASQTSNLDLVVKYEVELMDAQIPTNVPVNVQTTGTSDFAATVAQYLLAPAAVAEPWVRMFGGAIPSLMCDLQKLHSNIVTLVATVKDVSSTTGAGAILGTAGAGWDVLDSELNSLAVIRPSTSSAARIGSDFAQGGYTYDAYEDGTAQTWDISKLLSLYPTARYVAPLITTLVSLANAAWVTQVKTEL